MKKSYAAVWFILIILINISPTHAADAHHEVKAGDSLWNIANQYDTTVEDLKGINGLQSNLILPGQKLRVPIMYKVAAGDTLWDISQAYHSSIQAIKAANGLSSDLIYIGQQIKVPPKQFTMQGQYVLMTREEFKDWLFHHTFIRNVRRIQQHHTWSPSYKNFNGSNHFTLLKGMENYHVQEMGWKNIAQHLTTFPDGKVAVSRPFNMDPEGTIGKKANTAGLAIENVGNFDKGHDDMSEEQRETIVYITALLSLKFGLTPSIDTITYHHWWDLETGERVLDQSEEHGVKTCPGTGFFGGNSTKSAKNNFYPLVVRKMQKISRKME
ncbi:peptidoglycan recognition protein family protein [Alteribacillus bidgolensis]|uniref:Autolysin n=1 Tax=Alteribacillus bidgolensis TaxID=930129 RepID=A0A1G8FNU2_9BACI|nr:LysM peptidoglycan-binding domain-containing protein [Alteribacillus bidgolensis]SDH83822.1 LysM repeat-containing protein [Alteribacillus bidgolensis]